MALGGGAERWEIDLAIEAALDHHRAGAPLGTDAVCDRHGILDDADRRLVRDVVALRLSLEARSVAA